MISCYRFISAHRAEFGVKRLCRVLGVLDPKAWSPRELRHSFVSLLSDEGVPLEVIADLCGHAGTGTTGGVYRHQLRPVLQSGALVMDRIFTTKEAVKVS